MNIQEIRRENLRKWLSTRTAPQKEKSYFSQLLSGTASFGERSARRIEKDYDLGYGYLDSDDPLNAPRPSSKNPGGMSDDALKLIFAIELLDTRGAPGQKMIKSFLDTIEAFEAAATIGQGTNPEPVSPENTRK